MKIWLSTSFLFVILQMISFASREVRAQLCCVLRHSTRTPIVAIIIVIIIIIIIIIIMIMMMMMMMMMMMIMMMMMMIMSEFLEHLSK